MIDASTQWLINHMQRVGTNASIWCSDENVLHQIPSADSWPHKPRFISNRWDIAEKATHMNFPCSFSDFDLSGIPDQSVDHFFYRISKEKAVTHHLINQAFRTLQLNGQLWLSGQKNEGIKTYIEKAAALFGCEKNIQKDGSHYTSTLTKKANTNPPLNDDDYSDLRQSLVINNQLAFTKPGQFGWNKIDQGSALLVAEIHTHLSQQEVTFSQCLDLGCGYGYLSIATKNLTITQRTLTDNNAAALQSAARNCAHFAINATVVPSDAGNELTAAYDLILCNPPFHQGFAVDGDLTDKFLKNTQRLLSKNGRAFFVVNQFIPLEKKAHGLFAVVNLLTTQNGFKVVELRKSDA